MQSEEVAATASDASIIIASRAQTTDQLPRPAVTFTWSWSWLAPIFGWLSHFTQAALMPAWIAVRCWGVLVYLVQCAMLWNFDFETENRTKSAQRERLTSWINSSWPITSSSSWYVICDFVCKLYKISSLVTCNEYIQYEAWIKLEIITHWKSTTFIRHILFVWVSHI